MSRACLSTKSSGEFDQDRQIREVRISVHVYLTDKRAAAQVVYVTMRCGIELDEPRNIWGASLPPDDWDETAGLETGHYPSFPKYPRLPIIERSVHEPKFANNASDC